MLLECSTCSHARDATRTRLCMCMYICRYSYITISIPIYIFLFFTYIYIYKAFSCPQLAAQRARRLGARHHPLCFGGSLRGAAEQGGAHRDEGRLPSVGIHVVDWSRSEMICMLARVRHRQPQAWSTWSGCPPAELRATDRRCRRLQLQYCPRTSHSPYLGNVEPVPLLGCSTMLARAACLGR